MAGSSLLAANPSGAETKPDALPGVNIFDEAALAGTPHPFTMTKDEWAKSWTPNTGISADWWQAMVDVFGTGWPWKVPGVQTVTIGDDGIHVITDDDTASALVARFVAQSEELANVPVIAASVDTAFKATGVQAPEGFKPDLRGNLTDAGTIHPNPTPPNWSGGRPVASLATGAECSEGLFWWDSYGGNIRYWMSTAGHCRFGAGMGPGFVEELGGYIDNDTTNAWDPNVYGVQYDVGVYLVSSAPAPGGWVPPVAMQSRDYWNYCASGDDCPGGVVGSTVGRFTANRSSGHSQQYHAPSSPAVGNKLCKSGSTTGSSCGFFAGYQPSGLGTMNFLDGCGADHGDSGGPVTRDSGSGIVGMIQGLLGGSATATPSNCDGLAVNDHQSYFMNVGYVPYFGIQTWGGKNPYYW